jgi:small conductance mechanosensitive channel
VVLSSWKLREKRIQYNKPCKKFINESNMTDTLNSLPLWKNLVDNFGLWLVNSLPKLILIALLYLIIRWFVRLAIGKIQSQLQAKYEKEANLEKGKRINTLIGVVKGMVYITITTIFILEVLGELGIDMAPLLAGAGIIGLAVGFGAQELVRDVISGFFMLLENQLRVGDVVNINNTRGTVEEIELRTIRLRDLSGVVHVFQNGKIESLSNTTKGWSASVFDIGVAYSEDADHVMDIMKKVGEELRSSDAFMDLILEPMEVFGLDDFGESAIVIKARFKTLPGKQRLVGREYRKLLKLAFDKAGVEIPFPHRTLYWGNKSDPFKLEIEGEKNKIS